MWVDSTVVLIQCWGLCKLEFLRHRGNEVGATQVLTWGDAQAERQLYNIKGVSLGNT